MEIGGNNDVFQFFKGKGEAFCHEVTVKRDPFEVATKVGVYSFYELFINL